MSSRKEREAIALKARLAAKLGTTHKAATSSSAADSAPPRPEPSAAAVGAATSR